VPPAVERSARRYPLVEAMTALLFVLVVQRLGIGWETLAALILTGGLITLAAINLGTGLLPDVITLLLLWVGLVLSLASWFTGSRSAILGATLGYLILWGFPPVPFADRQGGDGIRRFQAVRHARGLAGLAIPAPGF